MEILFKGMKKNGNNYKVGIKKESSGSQPPELEE